MTDSDQDLDQMKFSKIKYYREKMESELKRAMEFWMTHSHDRQNGGFFTCLGQDGALYDTDKFGWMQARQVWTYCKLYNETLEYKNDVVLNAAISGGEFLMTHILRKDDYRCYFQVTADGKPVHLQRKLFTECFYAMAMVELGRATNIHKYQEEAMKMLSKIIYWARVDDSQLGVPKLEGQAAVNSMSVPMMVLCVLQQVCYDDDLRERYKDEEDWAMEQILQHMQRNGSVILESVSTDGKELAGYPARLMNPGHALEAGWFLLKHAIKNHNHELKLTAIDKFIKCPYDLGWDKVYSGIFYFLDADGLSPVPLEWNMKLAWVHSEALIALLMAYRETNDQTLLQRFDQCFEYTLCKFPDSNYGEWFGWLDRRGEVTHTFKGAPYKGCFHILRCLHMCISMLKDMESRFDSNN